MVQLTPRKWRFVAIVFMVITAILAITVVSIAIALSIDSNSGITNRPPEHCEETPDDITVSESDDPGVFHDLTKRELFAIQEFLYADSKLNLVRPDDALLNNSYVYTIDLYLPPKREVLDFLDENGSKPKREAIVIVFRGDNTPPVVEEYVVGPLPKPVYARLREESNRRNPIQFNYRPYGGVEFFHIYQTVYHELDNKLKDLLEESYGTRLSPKVCHNRCLRTFSSPVGSGVLGENVRKFWATLHHHVEYISLHPVGLAILIAQSDIDPLQYRTEDAIYNGQKFSSVDELALKYSRGEVIKHKVPFPNVTKDLFSTMNLRGTPVPEVPKRPPKLFEPDGKRYKISHRHVEYMQWSFDFRLSVIAGPQLYDIRFNDERLAYEVGIQEIAVMYSGHNPGHKTSDFVDSTEMLGLQSFGLVPGADCPDTSTFIDRYYVEEGSEEPEKASNSMCIFEENTGFPLRRHAGYGKYNSNFYSGMLSSSLVVRSVLTLTNYDYIVDFILHQNGALQIRTAASGYLFSSFFRTEERDYGFRLHDSIVGNMHQHLFNFKIDLDIHGTKNRYETLDITATEVDNEYSVVNASYWQTKFNRSLKLSEMKAAYKLDFNKPKYHFIHKNEVKTGFGEISGYRIHLEGMTYQPLPWNKGNEATMSWTRYQMAVTRHKDEERRSSSCYGMFDSLDPVVNFTSFLADDENIVDEDLVVWATVGLHHIPHTEDLPVTPTTGGHLGIYLLPYNYFKECPSVSSRDAIRIELKDKKDLSKGARVDRYGNTNENICIPPTNSDNKIEEKVSKSFY